MNTDEILSSFFKKNKFLSIVLIIILLMVIKSCMYTRIVKNDRVYIINKITNSYYTQTNSKNKTPWWEELLDKWTSKNTQTQVEYDVDEFKRDCIFYNPNQDE